MENTDNTVITVTEKSDALGPLTPQVIYKLTDQPKYEFITFGETEYSKLQKDLRRLTKMENKLMSAYKFEDKTGEILTVMCPLRLVDQIQTEAKEKLGDKYISVTETK